MELRMRLVNALLADEDSMTALCEEYGVSRKTGYKWLARFRAEGPGGLAERSLVVDTRLRDALRALRDGQPPAFPTPSLADDAEYAVEAAALSEAYAVRVQRQVDGLEQRLQSLESR